MATLEDGTPSDEGSEDERVNEDVMNEEEEDEAAPIWDEPKEVSVIEIAQDSPPPACEEPVPLIEGSNGFSWDFGGAPKLKKGKKKSKGITVGFVD